MASLTGKELAERGKDTRFKKGDSRAVASGRKGGIQQGVNAQKRKIIREAILQALTPEKLDRIARNAVQRAEKYDQSFTILRDTIDGKPTQEVSADISGTMSSNDRAAILAAAAAELKKQWSVDTSGGASDHNAAAADNNTTVND